MKALSFFIFFHLFYLNTFAQWNKVNRKTTYTYSQYSFGLKYSSKKNKYDTINKKQLPNFNISIDTIILLKGKERRLIVFSKSFYSFRLGEKSGIVKGRIEDLPKTQWGLMDNLKEIAVPEKFKKTIVYQYGTESYQITVPNDFLEKKLVEKNILAQFDNALLSLPTEKGYEFPLITTKYIFFQGMSLPMQCFIEFDKNPSKLNSLREGPYIDPGMGFFTYKQDNDATKSNVMFYSRDDKEIEKSSIYFSINWGITRVYGESIDQKDNSGEGIYLTLIDIK